MLEHLQYLMLSVFVLLVLQHLLYSYLLPSLPVSTKVNHAESALSSHALDFIFRIQIVGVFGFG